MNEEKGRQMADISKKKPHHLKRPALTACVATIFALSIAAFTDIHHFRNRSSDILFIEAIVLIIGAWASYLKSRGLAFLVLHPFRRKNLAESWIDGVPEKFVGSTQDMNAETRSLQMQRSREFRRDLAIASGILIVVGLIVQYII